jgi:uncharacterized protein YjbJ (UPF0337 family)
MEIDMDENRIEGGVKKAAGKVKETVGAAVGDRTTEASGAGRAMAGDAQRAYGQVADTVRDVAENATDYVRDAAGRTADTVRDVAGRTSGNVRDAAGRTADLARDASHNYPVQSLLIAGAIGFVCAMLLRRS